MFSQQTLHNLDAKSGAAGITIFICIDCALHPTLNGTEIRVYKSLKALIFPRLGIAHMAYFSAIPPYTLPSLIFIPHK